MLACVITDTSQVITAKPFCDLLEYRLDLFSELELSRLEKPSHPVVFTCRGENRFELIEKYANLKPEYIDLEYDLDPLFYEKISKISPHSKFIISYHNFLEVPDLNQLFMRMQKPFDAIYKIAAKANCSLDLLKMMRFLKEKDAPLSVIAMGEYGMPSRVLGKILGNEIDYTSLRGELPELYQISLKDLCDIYHYHDLGVDTQIYGLIGDPVDRSPGHLFHNRYFKEKSVDSVYLKFRLQKSEVKAFLKEVRHFPIRGLSVTMPLKEQVEKDKSFNTITFDEESVFLDNTDGKGALDVIEKRLSVNGRRIVILGAGGSSRAIFLEAEKRGAEVFVLNRKKEKAEKIAGRRGGAIKDSKRVLRWGYDVLINTTAVEYMLLIDEKDILSKSVIMDISHNSQTRLLEAARKKGCQVIEGREMFERQAILQQEIWLARNGIYVD